MRELLLQGKFRIIVIIFFVFALGSCQHNVEIKEESKGSESFTPLSEIPEDGVPIAYVKTSKVILEGEEYAPSDNTLHRFRNKLLETRLFYDIVFQRPAIPHVELNLKITSTDKSNKGLNATKVMVSALTLFLLNPVLPVQHKYHSEYSLDVTNLDQETKVYTAFSSGELEDSSLGGKFSKLYQAITNNNLNSLMSQLLEDSDFVLAPSPHPDSRM